MKRLSANTRTIVKSNYALITPDSYVGSNMPNWKNVAVRVLINPAMGANLSQYLITLNKKSVLKDSTEKAQICFYVIAGKCKIEIGTESKKLKAGDYVYVPISQNYQLTGKKAKLVAFQKTYLPLEGYKLPSPIFGSSKKVPLKPYLEDSALHMQYLLPDTPAMDFAVNIFTYKPGGNLPFVETHIMEHGLLFLQGEGIYRLDNDWHHVTAGDSIWMAPYCPQWFTAMGKTDAIYIYCKDVNRGAMDR